MKKNINRTVKKVLDSLGCEYARRDEDGLTLFAFLHVEDRCEYILTLNADEANGVLVVTGFYPGLGKVTDENYGRVSRAIDVLNYECPVGAILVNPTNGELSYRITHCVDGETVNKVFVRILLGMVIERMKATVETLGESLAGTKRIQTCRESVQHEQS